MHLLKFLGILLGFISWESIWVYIAHRNTDTFTAGLTAVGLFTVGLFIGVLVLMVMALIAMMCYGLWSVT